MTKCNVCGKTANFGFEKGKALKCSSCKEEGMRDVVNKMCVVCEDLLCRDEISGAEVKRANFGLVYGKATHCAKHKEEGMENARSKQCLAEGCKIQPHFGLPQDKPTYCFEHKLTGMIDLLNKLCQHSEGCDTRPTYGYEKNKPIMCGAHIVTGMMDATHDFCQKKNCNTRATYGNPGNDKPSFCAKHPKSGMVDIRSKRCLEKDCDIRPSFGWPDTTIQLYCSRHQKDGMINLHLKWCEMCQLTSANPVYKPLCAKCYFFEHPDDPRVRNYKTKELAFTKKLKEVYQDAVLDKIIQGGCSKRRPDFLLDLGSHCVIVEIDENQHIDYDEMCENKRTMQLYTDLGNRNLVIIRLNPDHYTSDGVMTKGCFMLRKSGELIQTKEFKNRFNKLLDTVERNIEKVPDKAITLVNLFMSSQ